MDKEQADMIAWAERWMLLSGNSTGILLSYKGSAFQLNFKLNKE